MHGADQYAIIGVVGESKLRPAEQLKRFVCPIDNKQMQINTPPSGLLVRATSIQQSSENVLFAPYKQKLLCFDLLLPVCVCV